MPPPVHNHGTEEGKGLLCPERRLADSALRGQCLDLFVKMPVVVCGRRVGTAQLSRDCEIINIELDVGEVPDTLKQMILVGAADAISIDVHTTPAVPMPISQEQKSARWNQDNLPHGM